MLKKLKEMLRGFGEVLDEIEYIIDKYKKLEKKLKAKFFHHGIKNFTKVKLRQNTNYSNMSLLLSFL